MLTSASNKVSLGSQYSAGGYTTWNLQVVHNGRIWTCSRTWRPDGTHVDKVAAKDNPRHSPHPDSPVAKAISRMITKFIDQLDA